MVFLVVLALVLAQEETAPFTSLAPHVDRGLPLWPSFLYVSLALGCQLGVHFGTWVVFIAIESHLASLRDIGIVVLVKFERLLLVVRL